MSTQEAIVNCVGIIGGVVAFCVFFYLLMRVPPEYTSQPSNDLEYQDSAWPNIWRTESRPYYEGYQPTKGPKPKDTAPHQGGSGLVTPKDHS